MLVPMATVRTTPAPSQQFPLMAPPLPVQNGAQSGNKVARHSQTYTANDLFLRSLTDGLLFLAVY